MRPSVAQMVRDVLLESEKKLAGAQDIQKTASKASVKTAAPKTTNQDNFLKLAEAMDFLADHLHEVADKRTPTEKLAEYAMVHEAITKKAFEVGNAGMPDPSLAGYKGEVKDNTQTTKAEPSSQPPMKPELDSGAPNPGGEGSALKAEPTNTPGTSLDAGQSGEATPANQPDKVTAPNEKPTPTSAANAMETNKDMMMPDQPADVLKQAEVDPGWMDAQHGMYNASRAGNKGVGQFMADSELIGSRLKGRLGGAAIGGAGGAGIGALLGLIAKRPALGAAVGGVAGLAGGDVAGNIMATNKFLRKRGVNPRLAGLGGATFSDEAAAKYLPKQASLQGVPTKYAKLLSKLAEDALNPAQISAGTEPVLQSIPGVPSQLPQGSEAGQSTPRETAPNVGEGAGRDYLSNSDAAINMTKGQAKQQNKSALSQLLAEPALSSEHDRVLQESLDNTSSAGVKIAAARQLLKKFAAQSANNKKLLASLIKKAQEESMSGAPALGNEPEPPTEEAMAAAAAGVTPEDLEMAHTLLALQQTQVEAPAAEMPVEAPVGEEAEGATEEAGKTGQFGQAPSMDQSAV